MFPTIDPESRLLVLNVEIFGPHKSRILRMACDTGATYVTLPWDVAEVLGYDPATSKERVKITTASGTERTPLIKVNKIKAWGESADQVKVICHDLPPESTIDGLLGLSFLSHFNLDLHFKDGKVELKDP